MNRYLFSAFYKGQQLSLIKFFLDDKAFLKYFLKEKTLQISEEELYKHIAFFLIPRLVLLYVHICIHVCSNKTSEEIRTFKSYHY